LSEEIELPAQYTHSVKLEETAKGVRVHVHAYANSQTNAIFEAVETLVNTRKEVEARGLVLAPVEVKTK
jgi:hypothetical protein